MLALAASVVPAIKIQRIGRHLRRPYGSGQESRGSDSLCGSELARDSCGSEFIRECGRTADASPLNAPTPSRMNSLLQVPYFFRNTRFCRSQLVGEASSRASSVQQEMMQFLWERIHSRMRTYSRCISIECIDPFANEFAPTVELRGVKQIVFAVLRGQSRPYGRYGNPKATITSVGPSPGSMTHFQRQPNGPRVPRQHAIITRA